MDPGRMASPDDWPTYEFGSASWLIAYQAVMATCVAIAAIDNPGLTFSICELATDPPPHLGGPDRPCGFHCFVRDGRIVRFGAGDATNVAYKVVASYELMSELCKQRISGSEEQAKAYRVRTHAAWEAGAIRTEGRAPKLPKVFGLIHDIVGSVTC